LKAELPYNAYLGAAVSEPSVDSEPSVLSTEGVDNTSYCPEGFDCISDLMHLYPLWARALHANAERFASDEPSPVEHSRVSKPHSNAKLLWRHEEQCLDITAPKACRV